MTNPLCCFNICTCGGTLKFCCFAGRKVLWGNQVGKPTYLNMQHYTEVNIIDMQKIFYNQITLHLMMSN